MRIVKGSRGDIQTIVNMWKELSDYHINFDDYLEPSREWNKHITSYFLKSMNKENYITFIAKTDSNRPIGFIKGEIRNTPEMFNFIATGYISELYVRDSYRGSKASEFLMLYLLNWFKGRGVSNIRLNVNSENIRAIKFYEKFGFKEVNKTLALKMS